MLAEESAAALQPNATAEAAITEEVVETRAIEAAEPTETPANEPTIAANENDGTETRDHTTTLTRAVLQALRALGADLSELDTPAPAAGTTTGGIPTLGGLTGGDGHGGVEVATSAAHAHVATAPLAVKAEATPAVPVGVPAVLSSAVNASGFKCGSCNEWNLRPTATHYYVVTVGREVGIFDDWHVVAPLVTGVSGAVFKRYSALEIAEVVWNEAVAEGRVRRV